MLSSETLPITVHPTNINRACPYTHSCSDAQPEAEAGKQTEACSHEKQAMLSLLSSSPAGPDETRERCRNDRCVSTIHRADGVGVKFCNLLFKSRSSGHARTRKHKHLAIRFLELLNQKWLSESWGRSKTSKVRAASGCVGRKLYYVIMLLGRFYLPVMKLVLCHQTYRRKGGRGMA